MADGRDRFDRPRRRRVCEPSVGEPCSATRKAKLGLTLSAPLAWMVLVYLVSLALLLATLVLEARSTDVHDR